jgi:hypothetical protein
MSDGAARPRRDRPACSPSARRTASLAVGWCRGSIVSTGRTATSTCACRRPAPWSTSSATASISPSVTVRATIRAWFRSCCPRRTSRPSAVRSSYAANIHCGSPKTCGTIGSSTTTFASAGPLGSKAPVCRASIRRAECVSTRLPTRWMSPCMVKAFRDWLFAEMDADRERARGSIASKSRVRRARRKAKLRR